MNEYDLIKQMVSKFQRSPDQHNDLFDCDAEIVMIGNQMWGISMDDFSPEEDIFTSEAPAQLGANIVVATLSDLLAAGAEPKFFMQSVSLPRTVHKNFVEELMNGVREMLDNAGCSLCGGDVGTADPWRFCGFGMGPITAHQPLTHCFSQEEQTLWVTGTLGDANLAALQNTATPPFELRLNEAEIIRKYATACIDTSGGFFDAIWLFHQQNPQVRFDIDLQKMPFAKGIMEASGKLGFPPESALLGGAGEYELLFAVPKGIAEEEITAIGATPIGSTRKDHNPVIHITRRDGAIKTMEQPPPCPRNVVTTEEHIRSVIKMAHNLFG